MKSRFESLQTNRQALRRKTLYIERLVTILCGIFLSSRFIHTFLVCPLFLRTPSVTPVIICHGTLHSHDPVGHAARRGKQSVSLTSKPSLHVSSNIATDTTRLGNDVNTPHPALQRQYTRAYIYVVLYRVIILKRSPLETCKPFILQKGLKQGLYLNIFNLKLSTYIQI